MTKGRDGARDRDHGDGPGGEFLKIGESRSRRDARLRDDLRRPEKVTSSGWGGCRLRRAATATGTRTVSGVSRWPCVAGKRNDAAGKPLEFDALDELLAPAGLVDAAGRAGVCPAGTARDGFVATKRHKKLKGNPEAIFMNHSHRTAC